MATTKSPEPSQLDKFRDLARELGADEDEAHFEETVKRVARKEPPKDEPPERDKAS